MEQIDTPDDHEVNEGWLVYLGLTAQANAAIAQRMMDKYHAWERSVLWQGGESTPPHAPAESKEY